MFRAATLTLFALAAVSAQEPPAVPPTKPKAEAATKGGDVPSAFRSFLVWDRRYDTSDVRNRTNKPHCVVCANGLNPVVAVFAPKIPTDPADPLVKLLQDIDQAVVDRKEASFSAVANFLVLPDELQFDAQRDKFADEAKALAEQSKLRAIPVGLAQKKSKATAAWKLDDNKAESVTVVFYNHLQVVELWTFEDGKPTAADRKAIIDAIEKEVPAKK